MDPQSIKLPYLPENIMEEIFHYLPYKSMARSKLVCKQWCSILSCPKFLNDHFALRLSDNNLILYDNSETVKFSFYDKSLVIDESFSCVPPCLEEANSSDFSEVRLLGTYNGLVAVSTRDRLILWNPLTNKCSFVLVEVYDSHSDGHRQYETRILFGLCYDGCEDEYMVVVGTSYQSPVVSPSRFDDDDLDYESNPVWLYNFKDGSEKLLKSELENRLLDQKSFRGEVGKVICGLPHWVVQYYDYMYPVLKTDILYFDFDKKVFKEMARPCGGEGDKTMLGLAGMDGENQLGCVLYDVASSCLEVWVMKEYGKSETWSNMFKFPYLIVSDGFGCRTYMDVIGFMPSGELLVFVNGKEFRVFDVGNGNSREVKLDDMKFDFVITYLPKLTLLPEPSKEIKGVMQDESDEGSSGEDVSDEGSSGEDESDEGSSGEDESDEGSSGEGEDHGSDDTTE